MDSHHFLEAGSDHIENCSKIRIQWPEKCGRIWNLNTHKQNLPVVPRDWTCRAWGWRTCRAGRTPQLTCSRPSGSCPMQWSRNCWQHLPKKDNYINIRKKSQYKTARIIVNWEIWEMEPDNKHVHVRQDCVRCDGPEAVGNPLENSWKPLGNPLETTYHKDHEKCP